MRGAISGLQAQIGKLSPKSIYNWCYAHRMNLVIEGLIASCTPIRNAIGILEELYVFIGGHN
jgi:maleate cis-trans isomerase